MVQGKGWHLDKLKITKTRYSLKEKGCPFNNWEEQRGNKYETEEVLWREGAFRRNREIVSRELPRSTIPHNDHNGEQQSGKVKCTYFISM